MREACTGKWWVEYIAEIGDGKVCGKGEGRLHRQLVGMMHR